MTATKPPPPDGPTVHSIVVIRVRQGWSRRTYRLPVWVLRELEDFLVEKKTPITLGVVIQEVAAELEGLGRKGAKALEEEP